MSVTTRHEVDLSGVELLYCKHIPQEMQVVDARLCNKYDALVVEEYGKTVAVTFSCKACLADVLDHVDRNIVSISLKHVQPGEYHLLVRGNADATRRNEK